MLADEILAGHPDEYLVQYRYAALLYEKRRYNEAAVEFQILIEKLPCNAFLYLSLGRVYEDMGCLDPAEIAFESALSLDRNPYTERAYARILSKIRCCDAAKEFSNQIVVDEDSILTKALSNAEVSLNCGYFENAACIYQSVLGQYPYNQEALWGLLKSSAYTGNSEDALLSYRRWPTVWFDNPLKNLLANYYRPPEVRLPAEYFHDSTSFWRASTGLNFSQYAFDDIRFYARAYYTRFGKDHFESINRESIYIGFDKLFCKYWEFRFWLIENCYDHLQHEPFNPANQNLYSKAVTNYHFHLAYHWFPEFTADIGYDYYDVIDTIPPFDNPIYNYSNQIGAAALNIRTSDVKLTLNYNSDKIYWYADFIYGRYSDGNIKKEISFREGYRFCDLPTTSIYYSYFYLSFDKPAPIFSQNGYSESAYYDPKNFEIHSIGIDSKRELAEDFLVGTEAALLYFPKARNFGYSGFIYFDYRLSDCWSCRLDLRYFYQNQTVTRTGISGYYHAENANFQIIYEY